MDGPSKIIKKESIDEDVSLSARLDLDDMASTPVVTNKKVLSEKELQSKAEADAVVEKALEEARQIRKKAKQIYLQVGEKMGEARLQGYEKGRQEGFSEVTQKLVEFEKDKQEFFDKIEKQAVSLVFDIASRLIGDALKQSESAVLGMVKQALQSAMGNELVLFLNPTDWERVRSIESQLVSGLQAMQTIQIKPSEKVKPGGCVIESELGTIDAQLDYQLAAIKKALGLG